MLLLLTVIIVVIMAEFFALLVIFLVVFLLLFSRFSFHELLLLNELRLLLNVILLTLLFVGTDLLDWLLIELLLL